MDLLLDGLIEREEDIGATITWAGETYACSAGALVGGKTIEAGGFRCQNNLQIVVRTSLFASGLPQEKQTLSYTAEPDAAAVTLRIDAITKIGSSALQLECNNPSQGA